MEKCDECVSAGKEGDGSGMLEHTNYEDTICKYIFAVTRSAFLLF